MLCKLRAVNGACITPTSHVAPPVILTHTSLSGTPFSSRPPLMKMAPETGSNADAIIDL